MGLIVNPVNAIFAGSDVTQASKNMKNEMGELNGENKYDKILKNKINKVPDNGGNINAVNTNPFTREAGVLIDELYQEKVAYESKAGRQYNGNNSRTTGKTNRFGSSNYSANHNNNNNNFGSPNNFKPDSKPNSIYPYVALGTILALSAADAISGGNPLQALTRGAKNIVYKYPKKLIGRDRYGKMFAETVKAGTRNAANNANNAKNIATKLASEIIDETYNFQVKSGSELIDEIYEKEAGINPVKKAYMKKLFKEDFVQKGVESIPYYGVPAALSYFVGRDLSRTLRPNRNNPKTTIVIDVPNKKIDKKASFHFKKKTVPIDTIKKTRTWKEWAKTGPLEKGVQGVSRTIFPAALIGLTGRNIRGAYEKMNTIDASKLPPVKPGDTRIIIETNDPGTTTTQKKATDIIEARYEKIAADITSDIEKANENTIKNISSNEADKIKRRENKTLLTYHLIHGQDKREKLLR